MNKFVKNKSILVYLLYFTMVFSLLYIVGQVIELDLSLARQVFVVFVTTLSTQIIINNKFLFYLALIMLIAGGLVGYYYQIQYSMAFEQILAFSTHIFEHIFNGVTLQLEYIFPLWIVIAVLYSIFSATIIFRMKRMQGLLLIISVPIFLYYWYSLGLDEAYYTLAFFLFAYMGLYGQTLFHQEERKTTPQFKPAFEKLKPVWIRTAFFYSFAAVCLAFIFPKSENRIQWDWLDDQVTSITTQIDRRWFENRGTETNNATQTSPFDFTTTGFQENPSRLGGAISPSEEIIMNVQTARPTYLRGAVKHHYNGNMWIEIETDSSEYFIGENFSRADEYDSYYDERNIIIEFKDYSSTTAFTPYYTTDIQVENKEQLTVNRDDIIEIPDGIYDNEIYRVTSLEAPSYSSALDLGINNYYEDVDEIEEYLQVPYDRLTQRTIDLKDEIINGIDGDYEKAKAFECYLSSNYGYTLNTSRVPEGHEFIDYFLFEEQAGYCTYFATAMAIFLRMEGIPSRYVEGYIARETTDGENYVVRQSHAHAWVEAYIEPIGWITLEPTASFSDENEETEPSVEEDTEELSEEVLDETINEQEIVEEAEPEEEIQEDSSQENTSDDEGSTEDESAEESVVEENASTNNSIAYIIIGVISFLVLSLILFSFVSRKYKKYQESIHKQPNDEKMLFLYQEILQQIEDLGYPKEPSETHYEYAKRIKLAFNQFEGITDIFVKCKYGNLSPTEDEIQKLRDYQNQLEGQLSSSLGSVKYFIYRCRNQLKIFKAKH